MTKNKNYFIIVSTKQKDVRAIFYNRNERRRRAYRNTYPTPSSEDLVIWKFYDQKKAQNICDLINENYLESFKVVEVDDTSMRFTV